MEDSVPKRRHIKFRRRGITQKKAYSMVWYILHAEDTIKGVDKLFNYKIY
jgi:hypothetical protein